MYDPGQYVVDSRDFVSAVYRHSVGPGEIQWTSSYDRYRYHDRFDYLDPVDGIEAEHDINRGDRLDSRVTYDVPVNAVGPLTVGVSAIWDLRAEQYNLIDDVRLNYTNRPQRGMPFFAQQEWKISYKWQLYGGLAPRRYAILWLGSFPASRAGLSGVSPYGVQAGLRETVSQSQRLRAVL
jgi:hypothetical protein